MSRKKLNWKMEDLMKKNDKNEREKKWRICRKRIRMITINMKERKENNYMKTCKCHVERQIWK